VVVVERDPALSAHVVSCRAPLLPAAIVLSAPLQRGLALLPALTNQPELDCSWAAPSIPLGTANGSSLGVRPN
jgi:hypothetical protein